jgi:hypothetical protein
VVTRGTLAYLVSLFFSTATGRTAGPILTLDDSYNADFAKEVPSRSGENEKKFQGSNFHQKVAKMFSSLHRHENF